MNQYDSTVVRSRASALATNKVLKNTYLLLSMTLLFSALMAGLSMTLPVVGPGLSMFSSLGALALIWLVLPRTENSTAGIFVVFAIAGLLGFGLGPLLSYYLAIPGGPRIVGTALGGTGIVFLGLSAYALTSKRDFSFMGGFLFAGLIVVLIAMVANIFLEIPALQLTVSAAIVLLMSGLILFDTSRIIHGGETNYIRATVGLYLDIYNLFVALLQLLGAFAGDD
ncbi:MAG TPA: Bax inhibitor-1/YccA family protein [Gammaproteobacteria bacterium]|nr:Bax inhibitor-1/YccA family protein [Gammaproteobacteria bacterium]